MLKELNVSYTYTVTNPVEGHEYTWEITYYGGDSNSAADAEDYVMETNDAKTTMTVTFLHSADFRVEFMDETCGIGGDMAAYVPKSYTAESQTLCASDGEYQYSVAASEKFWGDDDEFILVVGDKSFHAFGNDGAFTVDFTLSDLEAGDYDNVVMFDADSAEVLAGPTTISLLPNLTIEGSSSVAVAYVDETVAASDIFHYHIKGTSNFTGEAILSLVDISEEVGYWDALSTSKTISVEENGEFNVEGYFIADKAPSSSTPIVAFTVGRAGAQSGETSTICGLESEISNYSADFECDGQKIALESDYGKPLMDISDEVAVGDKYYCHVEGVADFSGEAYIAMVDRSAEAQWWFDITTAASFEVTEGEPFEFNDVFEVTAQTTSTNPVFSVMIGHFGSSEGNVFQICVTDSEIEKQMACSPDATQVEFEYYAESENYTYRLDGLASNAVAGDQYTVVWEGTPTCGGWLNFSLIDRSEAANWWKEVAEWESIQIEKGVPFTINKTFTITDSVSAASEIAFFATIDGKEGYGSSICQTEFSFTQQCHNAALVGSLSVPLAYVDGSVAKNDIYNYNVKGHSDFAGEVMLSLVDQS
ncbi:MAG: hypothetical protein II663_04150, partial [Bacteroidales bacterium]|nr:hypothetical protein [Bacteroidales bacterium]